MIDNIKLVFFGTPIFSAYILERLIELCQNPPVLSFHPKGVNSNLPKKFTIQAVITSPDKPVGRKQIVIESPVTQVAEKYHLPVLKPDKLDDDFISSTLGKLTSDLFIVAAYGKILPENLLKIPKFGAINVHGSILPKYRGASPIQTAILNGDKKSGITIMLMDEKMDHGPIISTKGIIIAEQDNFLTLSNKMSQEGAKLLIQTLPKYLAGKIKPKPQNHQKATYTKLVKKEDGLIDINPPAGGPPSPEVLDRMIRAYYPWPGVWTKWNNKIVKFYPGNLVQMEGKKPLPVKDFQNGYPDFPIKNLG